MAAPLEYSQKCKDLKINTTWNLFKCWQKICQCTLEEKRKKKQKNEKTNKQQKKQVATPPPVGWATSRHRVLTGNAILRLVCAGNVAREIPSTPWAHGLLTGLKRNNN